MKKRSFHEKPKTKEPTTDMELKWSQRSWGQPTKLLGAVFRIPLWMGSCSWGTEDAAAPMAPHGLQGAQGIASLHNISMSRSCSRPAQGVSASMSLRHFQECELCLGTKACCYLKGYLILQRHLSSSPQRQLILGWKPELCGLGWDLLSCWSGLSLLLLCPYLLCHLEMILPSLPHSSPHWQWVWDIQVPEAGRGGRQGVTEEQAVGT